MTPGQCRAARSWLRWSTRITAEKSGVSRSTLVRFESGQDVLYSKVDQLRKTFETAGIRFVGRTVVEYDQNG